MIPHHPPAVAKHTKIKSSRVKTWAGFIFAIASLGLSPLAAAHDYTVGDLVIEHPYANPSLAGVRNGAAYLQLVRNRAAQPDRLLGASTPVAARVELHRMETDGQIMRMREVSSIEVPASGQVALARGGLHMMLIDLKQPLKAGDRFDLTLRFERAGSQKVEVMVQAAQAPMQSPKQAPASAAHHHH